MTEGSRLRMLAKKLYSMPVAGYFARLSVALFRLPEAESYHAAVLREHSERLSEIEARPSDWAVQARLTAKLAALLEEVRAAQATTRATTQKRIDEISRALDSWVEEFLNKWAIHQTTLQALEKAVAELQSNEQAAKLRTQAAGVKRND